LDEIGEMWVFANYLKNYATVQKFDNFVFSMKTLTFISQINCKMNRKYSQDIGKVRNNDYYFKY